MPPTPKPPKPIRAIDKSPVEEKTAMALFAKNLAEIERYHRRQPTGHELGQHVITGLILGDVKTALVLAIEGKAWDPPT